MSDQYLGVGNSEFDNPEKQLSPTKVQYQRQLSLKQSVARSVFSMHQNESGQKMLQYFKKYECESEFIQMSKLHISLDLKLKRYKQSVYYGEIINQKRQGNGIMIYNNERLYQGSWQVDYKHGKGLQKFPNGCIYQGDYINGKPQGIGKYSWPNGEFYQGQWLNGMKHGSGMWKGAKGDSYVGQWKFGKADGYGVHTWINNDRYQGEFKESLKHGEGLQKFNNGDIYKGYYAHGKPQGFGQYYWANGSYFKGVFKNGSRNGQGIWKKGPGNSDKYQGEYLNDRKSGFGIFTWASGNTYKGNYENDSRNGIGQMYWTDGSFYKGEWQNGIQHGMGQIYVPSEGVKKGVFQNNTLIHIQEQFPYYPEVNQNDGNYSTDNRIPGRKNSTQKSTDSYINGKNDKASFRSRGQSSNKSNKSVDQVRVFRLSSHYDKNSTKGFSSSKNNPNMNKISMRFGHQSNMNKTIDTRALKEKQRVPHSAFYMHKMYKPQNANDNTYQGSNYGNSALDTQKKNVQSGNFKQKRATIYTVSGMRTLPNRPHISNTKNVKKFQTKGFVHN